MAWCNPEPDQAVYLTQRDLSRRWQDGDCTGEERSLDVFLDRGSPSTWAPAGPTP